MAALVAAIHVFGSASKDVDGRDKPGHDDENASVPMTVFDVSAGRHESC
jgi:hypothetical protein